jgi:hypothetical protein
MAANKRNADGFMAETPSKIKIGSDIGLLYNIGGGRDSFEG